MAGLSDDKVYKFFEGELKGDKTCAFEDYTVICMVRKVDLWIKYKYFHLTENNHDAVINANACEIEAPCMVVISFISLPKYFAALI